MLEYLSRYWWTLAVRGALAVVFGLAALIWPEITLRVLVLLFGFYAVVDGLLALAAVLVGGRLVSGRRGWLVFEGIVGIATGVFTFLWPGITALVLLYLIAAWAIVTGYSRSPPPPSCAGSCTASGSLPSSGSSRWPSASSSPSGLGRAPSPSSG
jgi:uncharacterized membrane protein HdeD (DUF308 family)